MMRGIAESAAVSALQCAYGPIGVELYYWNKTRAFQKSLASFMFYLRHKQPVPVVESIKLTETARAETERMLVGSRTLRAARKLPRRFRSQPFTKAVQAIVHAL